MTHCASETTTAPLVRNRNCRTFSYSFVFCLFDKRTLLHFVQNADFLYCSPCHGYDRGEQPLVPAPVVSLSLDAKVEAVAGEGGGAGRLEFEEIGANQACRMANCLFFVHFCHVCQTHQPTPLSGRKSYLCRIQFNRKRCGIWRPYMYIHPIP